MKTKYLAFLLILTFCALAFALPGCKGGSSRPPSSAYSIPPGLWKVILHTVTKAPSVYGSPPMNRSENSVSTTCVKPGSDKSKSYIPTPVNKNIKCGKAKIHVSAGGAIRWTLQCKGPKMAFAGKGKTVITADSLKSRAVMTETMEAPDNQPYLIKITMDETATRISAECPPKS